MKKGHFWMETREGIGGAMNHEATDANGRKGLLGQSWKRTSLALQQRGVIGVLFTAPVGIILLLLLAYPFVLGIWLSFTDTIIGRTGKFIGLENYLYLITDDVFLLTTFNTLLYTAAAVLFKLIFGFALAIVLNRDFKGKGLVRAIVLLPWIVPTALSTIVFWWLLDSQFSCFSWVLMKMGIISNPIDFLGIPNNARASVIAVNVWRGIPFFTIGLMAGLQTINPSLYEAADIDGAGPWVKFKSITLPVIMPLLAVITTFSIIWTFADFHLIWIMTRGGPANATHIYGTLSYQRAIPGGHLGEGAAISIFIFPILLICVLLTARYLRRED
jgi:multiple sugar transport system permease protein